MGLDFNVKGYPKLEEQKKYTQTNFDKLRINIENILSGSEIKNNICIVATGSYGRGEASGESDLDVFTILEDESHRALFLSMEAEIESAMTSVVAKQPGSTATFGATVSTTIEDFFNNIGGDEDDNRKFTRRMLFLLEGRPLFNDALFIKCRTQLLNRYIKSHVEENQIARFFLNDIIRYWRTIATDYEYKISENGKTWGVRNAKLRFSRKLLYFSGIIAVAETSQGRQAEKIACMEQLLALNPVERIQSIGRNNQHTGALLKMYDNFLEEISKCETRAELEKVSMDSREENTTYVELRSRGRHFTRILATWLQEQYPGGHPIHDALLF